MTSDDEPALYFVQMLLKNLSSHSYCKAEIEEFMWKPL